MQAKLPPISVDKDKRGSLFSIETCSGQSCISETQKGPGLKIWVHLWSYEKNVLSSARRYHSHLNLSTQHRFSRSHPSSIATLSINPLWPPGLDKLLGQLAQQICHFSSLFLILFSNPPYLTKASICNSPQCRYDRQLWRSINWKITWNCQQLDLSVVMWIFLKFFFFVSVSCSRIKIRKRL